jgi:hypothetical protein
MSIIYQTMTQIYILGALLAIAVILLMMLVKKGSNK